ncbi:PASTA domain-containing protein [Williamsia sp. M5A3_1d]
MPAVVRMNLQDAQDRIQENGVFFSRSEDATGQGRRQVMDRNWIVVAQDPAPGSPVSEAEAVLSVVRESEPNNC